MSSNENLEFFSTLRSDFNAKPRKKPLKKDKNVLYSQLIKQSSSNEKLITLKFHSESILTLSVSPCNKYIASGSSNGVVIISNIQQQSNYYTLFKSKGKINSLAFSSSGEFLICGLSSNFVEIWDLNLRYLVLAVEERSSIKTVLFSPNGKYFAYSCEFSFVIWNFIENKLEYRCSPPKVSIGSIVFSPDGKNLIIGSINCYILFWNVEEKKNEFEFSINNKVCSMAISNDGKNLVYGTINNYIMMYQIKKNIQKRLFVQKSHVWSLAFSPDNKYIAISDYDKVFVWSKRLKAKIYKKLTENSIIFSITFSLDQKNIFAAGSKSKIYMLKTTEKIKPYIIAGGASNIAISKDNKYLAVLQGLKNELIIWDLEQKVVYYIFYVKIGAIDRSFFKFTDDNNYIVNIYDKGIEIWNLTSKILILNFGGGYEYKYAISNDSKFFIYTNELKKIIYLMDTHLNIELLKIFELESKIKCFAFSPDNKYISYGLENTNIKVWSIDNNNNYCIFYYRIIPFSLLYSNNGDFLIIGTQDGTISLWDFLNKCITFTFTGHSKPVKFLKFTSKYLISQSTDNHLIFWNFEKRLKEFSLNKNIKFFDVSYDNKYIIKNKKGAAQVFKLQNFFESKTSDNILREPKPLSFSNDGKYAVSGNLKKLNLWSVKEKREIWSFNAHKLWVRSVAFSNDSKFIVSGGDDNMVKIWNIDGCEIKSFEGHFDWVLGVCFSIDDKFVASASKDMQLKIWGIEIKNNEIFISGFKQLPKTISLSKSSKYLAVEYTIELFAIFNTLIYQDI